MNISDFLIPFSIIALSELGDKTQFAIFALSSKKNQATYLIIGIILAFALTTAIAVFFGSIISSFLPKTILNLIAGILFLTFGVLTFNQKICEDSQIKKFNHPFITSFAFIFISEIGDKSQLTTSLFTINFNKYLLFFGAFIALSAVSLATMYLGRKFSERVNTKLLSKVAGSIFVILGIFYFGLLFYRF